MHIGSKIKRIADSKNLSQKEVADRIGDKQQNVSNDYKKDSLTFDRMLLYSEGLTHNFFQYYNNAEPYKTYREKEFELYKDKIELLTQQLNELKKLLTATEETITYQTRLVETQKELIEKLKENNT